MVIRIVAQIFVCEESLDSKGHCAS